MPPQNLTKRSGGYSNRDTRHIGDQIENGDSYSLPINKPASPQYYHPVGASITSKTEMAVHVNVRLSNSRSWAEIFKYTIGAFMGSLMVGIATFIAANLTEGNWMAIGFAAGLTYAAVVLVAFRKICLGYINPMVTLAAVFFDSKTSVLETLFYIPAQFGGFILAALLNLIIFDSPRHNFMVTVVDALNTGDYSAWQTFIATLLVAAIWIVAVVRVTMRVDPVKEFRVRKKYLRNAIVLGFLLLALHACSVDINGGAIGLARSIMPSVVRWRYNPFVAHSYWAIPVGIIVGSGIGMLICFLLDWTSSSSVSFRIEVDSDGTRRLVAKTSLSTGQESAV